MPLLTTEEVKLFLGISGSAKDTLINALIPQAEAIITDWCNKDYSADWPIALKIPGSMIVQWLMSQMSGGGLGMQSESQGQYSYTKAQGQGGIPSEIAVLLAPYKVARVGFGSKLTQNHDRRGMTLAQLASDKVIVDVVAGNLYDEDLLEQQQ